MSNIIINRKKRTIEITKAFDKASSRFGTEEYNELKEVRRDNPNFSIIIKKGAKRNNASSRLSYEFMENYIDKHDNQEKELRKEYESLRGLSEEAKELGMPSASYKQIEEWFYSTFLQFESFKKLQEQIISNAKNRNNEEKGA